MNARRRIAGLALALLPCGCNSLTVRPAVVHATDDVLGATRAAVEQALAGTLTPASGAAVNTADANYAQEAHQPAGLAARVAVLEALAVPSRDVRIDALEATRKDSNDPLFQTHVDHLLEQDDAWFARALEHDTVWSAAAGFFNGALASGYALLNGNPVGVVKPLVLGVDGLIRDVPLDARDRKLAALKKRMAEKGESSENLTKEIAALEEATVKEELWLADHALAGGRADIAAMHWWVAKTVRPGDDDVLATAGKIEEQVKARGARLDLALRVDPIESGVGFEERDAWARIASATAMRQLCSSAFPPEVFAAEYPAQIRTLPGTPQSSDPPIVAQRISLTSEAYFVGWLTTMAWANPAKRAQLDAVAMRVVADALSSSPRGDVPTARADLLRASPAIDPLRAVAAAEKRHGKERERYVWTGRRDSHDPLRRYAEARAELHRSILDRIEPIFWVPATIFRSAYNAFTDPVNDQPLVDELARTARNLPPDDERRAGVLTALAERLGDRGSAEQALAVAQAAGVKGAPLAKYERKAKDAAQARADERARRDAAIAASGATIPAYALAPYATRYGFSRALVDGRRDNGEVAPRGVHLDGSKLTLDVEEGGEISCLDVTLNDVETRRMDALAREWGWRKRAGTVETYAHLHEGWPVEMYAGVGASGVAAYPRLLPEDISAADRKLWE